MKSKENWKWIIKRRENFIKKKKKSNEEDEKTSLLVSFPFRPTIFELMIFQCYLAKQEQKTRTQYSMEPCQYSNATLYPLLRFILQHSRGRVCVASKKHKSVSRRQSTSNPLRGRWWWGWLFPYTSRSWWWRSPRSLGIIAIRKVGIRWSP